MIKAEEKAREVIPIDAKELLNELNSMGLDDYNYELYSEIFDMIDQAPVLDYAPVVHARWILCVYGDGCVHATLCGHCGMLGKESNKYCPTCGAVMDLPEEYREER